MKSRSKITLFLQLIVIFKLNFQKRKQLSFLEENYPNYTRKTKFACDNDIFPKRMANKNKQWTHLGALTNFEKYTKALIWGFKSPLLLHLKTNLSNLTTKKLKGCTIKIIKSYIGKLLSFVVSVFKGKHSWFFSFFAFARRIFYTGDPVILFCGFRGTGCELCSPFPLPPFFSAVIDRSPHGLIFTIFSHFCHVLLFFVLFYFVVVVVFCLLLFLFFVLFFCVHKL